MLQHRVALSAWLAFIGVGCVAGAEKAAAPRLDPQAFIEAKQRIAALKATVGGDRTDTISLELDAPYLPSRVKARGAMAVRVPDRLRMIMLGPGGTTAMDLWMKGDSFRFSIPSLGRELAGDASTPAEKKRGLPVDFLRAFMLDPLGGRVLAASRRGADLEVLIDEPPNKIVELTLRGNGALRVHRSWFSSDQQLIEEEWIEASGLGCATATYRQKTTQLLVTARCEKSRVGLNEAALEEPAPAGVP
jgi:hypothetical protein